MSTLENKLIARPFTYNELLSYQEDTVASRTIIDKKTGTVTVFAFDAGQRLSTHSAPFDALVQITDGKALITIEEKKFELKAGEQIIMPANKPHSVAAPEKFKMVLIMIKSN
ncbi:MAG TPA: cupin domain-containing protein [Lentisphaeria bacterium]|nr:MAG: cupin [Lentisphaerae bacterium GWF2_38_69]HBM15855.1 cupin domain-containing protein [Lentisphaeria bacterium]